MSEGEDIICCLYSLAACVASVDEGGVWTDGDRGIVGVEGNDGKTGAVGGITKAPAVIVLGLGVGERERMGVVFADDVVAIILGMSVEEDFSHRAATRCTATKSSLMSSRSPSWISTNALIDGCRPSTKK